MLAGGTYHREGQQYKIKQYSYFAIQNINTHNLKTLISKQMSKCDFCVQLFMFLIGKNAQENLQKKPIKTQGQEHATVLKISMLIPSYNIWSM